jgi:hypothetical protein
MVIGVLVALGLFVQAAVRYPTDQATAWFTGIGVIVAIVALVAAALAARFAYEDYRGLLDEQRRKPRIEIKIEAGAREDLQPINPAENLHNPAH